jgi:hypothetical protein
MKRNLALLTISSFLTVSANANVFNATAHQMAIDAVVADLSNPKTELGKANIKMLKADDNIGKPAETLSTDGDMGGYQALTLSQLESTSNIFSTELVRITYSTGGTPTLNDSLTVKVNVNIATDPSTGDIQKDHSSATIVPDSITYNTQQN